MTTFTRLALFFGNRQRTAIKKKEKKKKKKTLLSIPLYRNYRGFTASANGISFCMAVDTMKDAAS